MEHSRLTSDGLARPHRVGLVRGPWLLACALALGATSCAGWRLTAPVGAPHPINDQSAVAPTFGSRHIRRVMVLPPSRTSGEAFSRQLTQIERTFLVRGVAVISSAITGRAVANRPGSVESSGAATAVSALSDVERGLVLARDSGADAILQVGEWGFSGQFTRFFCGQTGDGLTECTQQEFSQTNNGMPTFAFHRSLTGRVFKIVGRLIDVQNGEVLASIDISMPSVYRWPSPVLQLERGQREIYTTTTECLYDDPESQSCGFPICPVCLEAERSAATEAIQRMVERVIPAPAAPPSSPEAPALSGAAAPVPSPVGAAPAVTPSRRRRH